MDTQAGRIETWGRSCWRGSTHLASTNWPVLGHRRVVDPIWPRTGPVPVGLCSVFPLHTRSRSPYSPFRRCGPGPFSLSPLTETGTNGIINFSAHNKRNDFIQSNASCWARQPISTRDNVPPAAQRPMRSGQTPHFLHFLTPPVLFCCPLAALSALCWRQAVKTGIGVRDIHQRVTLWKIQNVTVESNIQQPGELKTRQLTRHATKRSSILKVANVSKLYTKYIFEFYQQRSDIACKRPLAAIILTWSNAVRSRTSFH